MDHLRRSSQNTFGGWDGDRLVERRDDRDWINAALRDPETRLVPIWRARSLIEEGDPLRIKSIVFRGQLRLVRRWCARLADVRNNRHGDIEDDCFRPDGSRAWDVGAGE